MKQLLYALLLLAAMTGCQHKSEKTYVHDILLPMTPVKNQGSSQLCWAYAMLATIETEHLVRGDSVNLSATYVGRMLPAYRKAYRTNSERAMCQTLLNIISRYGIVGYDVMPDDATADLPTPRYVFMLGARYTPREFAHSVCAPNEYIAMTCQPNTPYYIYTEVPIADNWEHNRLLNVPMDTLRSRTDRALKNRHPVCWENSRHAMAIVGLAHDQQQRRYYVMKNSWGSKQPHGGLVYMPCEEAWRDVVAIYMTHAAYEE